MKIKKKIRKILNKIKKITLYFKCLFQKNFFFSLLKSQSGGEESKFLLDISDLISDESFLEIGFSYYEFNCTELLKKNFKGTLVDGSTNSFNMNLLLKKHKLNSRAYKTYLNLDNLNKIEFFKRKYGFLSLDIDGVDYWILKEMLKIIEFEAIMIEYNASLLHKKISVVYKKNFDRFEEHKSGLYHGASLAAFNDLLNNHDFSLVKIIGGLNAVFLKNNIIKQNNLTILDPLKDFQEHEWRNKFHNSSAKQQFSVVKHLNFIEV